MSRIDLENSSHDSPARRVLRELKLKGPQTASELGTALGVTGEAARLQLVRLAERGMVEASSEIRGVGRPLQKWRLTKLSQDLFPDSHDQLASQLIDHIRTTLGGDALARVLDARDEALRATYRSEMRDAASLRERVRRLAAIRDREGYMCEWRQDGRDYLLIENHCPICDVATRCRGLCDTELNTFKAVLGRDASVTREEHMMNGDRRCVYRISARPKK
jgi:predicted ArsR family transcriptional regulator